MKGFEAYASDVGVNVEEPIRHIDEKENINENRHNIAVEDISCDTLVASRERHSSSDVLLKEPIEGELQANANSDLDLQILKMIEKSDGVWKCKACGKTNAHKGTVQIHAESHIKGISHACHICNKSFSTKKSLCVHINNIHSELFSCDLCGKSGMNKNSFRNHKRKEH